MDVGVHRGDGIRREGDAVIMSRMDVVKSVEGSFHVSRGRFIAIRSKEGVNGRKIRAGRT